MSAYRLNTRVEQVATPPISDVQGWIKGRSFDTGFPLLDVSQAVPSYQPAAELRSHFAELLEQPDTSMYTDIVGITPLRAALAKHLSADYAGQVRAEHVAITAGCNQAFSTAIDALAEPGDEIVLPVPYYFNHHMWLAMRGVVPVYVHAREGEVPLEDIDASIGARTRAVVLVNPDNPTGRECSPDYIGALFEIARSKEVALIVDETYKDFRSTAGPPHRLFQDPAWDKTFVHLFSFSKAYAVTGYRVGALVGHPNLIGSAEKLLDCATICASHLAQKGALFALQTLSTWKQAKSDMMKQRMRVLEDCFKRNELRFELVSSGAYFAYVRHPFENQNATTVAKRLADEFNILCLPGSMFGNQQESFLRFAFANLEAEQIPVLVQRLIDAQD